MDYGVCSFNVLKGAYYTRKQFPLMPAFGITIHKSQGLSFSSVIVDAGASIFGCGMIIAVEQPQHKQKKTKDKEVMSSSGMGNEYQVIGYSTLLSPPLQQWRKSRRRIVTADDKELLITLVCQYPVLYAISEYGVCRARHLYSVSLHSKCTLKVT